jgi:hypothetical protein
VRHLEDPFERTPTAGDVADTRCRSFQCSKQNPAGSEGVLAIVEALSGQARTFDTLVRSGGEFVTAMAGIDPV